MAKFRVTFKVVSLYDMDVEADSGAEARALMNHELGEVDFVHDLTHDGVQLVDSCEVYRVNKVLD